MINSDSDTIPQEIRWIQRFENYQRAFTRLENTFIQQSTFTDLEKEGIIQRFEYVFELAWETLKDYIEYTGLDLYEKSPRSVIKKSFQANMITDGEGWINMLLSRNLLSHRYDIDMFKTVFVKVETDYLPLFKELYIFLKGNIHE